MQHQRRVRQKRKEQSIDQTIVDFTNELVLFVERTASHRIKDWFTSDDFLTDDPVFDAVLHATAEPHDVGKNALTPAVRAALLALHNAAGGLCIKKRNFALDDQRIAPSNAAAVVRALEQLGRAVVGLPETSAP